MLLNLAVSSGWKLNKPIGIETLSCQPRISSLLIRGLGERWERDYGVINTSHVLQHL